jgi:hypothetical protein
LAGLIASAIAGAASQAGGGRVQKRKRRQRDLVAASIKSGYNPGPRSFIDIMQYHRGLLHQRGHGWGALAKIAAKVAAPIVGQAVGGLLGGTQTGQGLRENKQTGHGYMDFIFNAGKGIAETLGGQNVPGLFKSGKVVLDKKVIAQSGRGVKRVKRIKRRKKQKGKGMITDLLKRRAKQALRAAAQTGLDVLDNKRSLKEAIKTHGIRAIKSTAQPLLAHGGPKKPKKRLMKRPMKRPPIKRA